uniref:Ubiquitin carboxyl-terminal hydrolase 36 n=1 Tax=Petromyzon marinus TaxID=7757 RepID=S4RZI0_PETMA
SLRWENDVGKGASLHNLGNTCFLNATLQCLAYTPPLVNYLLLQEHCSTCKAAMNFTTCWGALEECNQILYLSLCPHVHSSAGIAKHLRIGRQEDAHEFLRYVVDAMQASCLHGHSDTYGAKEAQLPLHIALIQRWRKCLSMLENITYPEHLDMQPFTSTSQGEPAIYSLYSVLVHKGADSNSGHYYCYRRKKLNSNKTEHQLSSPACKVKGMVKYSNLLVSTLDQNITYPEHLDMQPFTSTSQGEPAIYSLYSVLVHKGADSNSGHYYCYNK